MTERTEALTEAECDALWAADESCGCGGVGADLIAAVERILASRLAVRDGEVVEVQQEHRWFEYGRWFAGFGSSMDPHTCGDPGTTCEVRERTVTVGPWSEWTRPAPDASGDAGEGGGS